MKRVHFGKLLLAAAVIVLALLPSSALAHPGRTDKYGGHTDSSTGIYHYHHGHTAHLHEGGVCPYGDYEEWLVKNGVQTGFWTEADELAHTAQAEAAASSFAWEGLGIGAGAAAAAGRGFPGRHSDLESRRRENASAAAVFRYDADRLDRSGAGSPRPGAGDHGQMRSGARAAIETVRRTASGNRQTAASAGL